jgi:hypothetical protein
MTWKLNEKYGIFCERRENKLVYATSVVDLQALLDDFEFQDDFYLDDEGRYHLHGKTKSNTKIREDGVVLRYGKIVARQFSPEWRIVGDGLLKDLYFKDKLVKQGIGCKPTILKDLEKE